MIRKNVKDFARPLFSLGDVVATKHALLALERIGVPPGVLLIRHQSGDWGNLCESDKELNEQALVEDLRLFSSYEVMDKRIWIITEADRSITTILLPEEY